VATEPTEQASHLAAIAEGITSQVSPEHAEMLQKVVVSGQQLLYSKETHSQILDGIRDMDDDTDPRKVAMGIGGLLSIINKEAEDIPVELMAPAGGVLATEVLQFLIDAGMMQESPEFTGNVIEELLAILMQKMGMKPRSAEQQQEQPQPQGGEIPGGVSPSQRGIISGQQQSMGVR
jgi:hypothetical protein